LFRIGRVVAGDAGGVGEQMPQGDGVKFRWQLRDVTGDGILQVYFFLFHQLHDGSGGKLLGHGANLVESIRCRFLRGFLVAIPISLVIDRAAGVVERRDSPATGKNLTFCQW
jgi:hypothetical protein